MPIRKERQLSPMAPKHCTRVGYNSDGGGLYLQVKATKDGDGFSRSWVFRYFWQGRRRDMGLGSVKDWSLSEARDRAYDLRQMVSRGIDPIADRTSKKAKPVENPEVVTFGKAASAYVRKNEKKWTHPVHRRQWQQSLQDYILPILGPLDVARISTKDVVKALQQPVKDEDGKEHEFWEHHSRTADRCRNRIELILGYAIAHEYRTAENCASWSILKNIFSSPTQVKKTVNYPALDYHEAPEFMRQLRRREGHTARALEFLILNASRTSEVLGATWDEIDLPGKVWVIPKERMKGEREHRVPLSYSACDILLIQQATRQNEFIFPGNDGALNRTALLELVTSLNPGITVHGWRATMKTWASEETDFAPELSEAALAHKVPGVAGLYNRGDLLAKRRALMESWNKYLST